ncbi:hypothetical protein LCGC14_0405110 [marine sediment metagenome]|uniref:Phage tail tape measure protein domain-containing protein n=1 Tax=marine sediment metagenome TaxID=412755 RepID=A0A0F9TDI2_9ZZZZ
MANDIAFKVTIDPKQAQTALVSLQKNLKSIGEGFTRFGRQSAVAFAGFAAVIGGVTFAFANFESQLIDIQRTTGITGDELKDLGSEILELSKNSDRSAIELGKIAAAAGQLGIQGSQNILTFTKTVAQVSTALGFAAEFTATALARISKAFDIPIDDVERLSSSINELSQTTSASAEEIVIAIQNVAPVLGRLAFSEEQIAGLTATFIELTGSGERAAVALSRFFSQASDNFDKLAEVTGLSQDSLKELFDTDPTKFFLSIQKGFAGVESNALRTAKAQEIFGIQGARAVLANNEQIERLVKNLNDSEKAFNENVSIQEEFEATSKKLLFQLGRLRNIFQILFIDLGQRLAPTIRTIIDGLTNLALKFEALPDPIKDSLANALLLGAALTGMFAILGFGIGFILKAASNFIALGRVLVKVAPSFKKIALGIRGISLALLANPIGLIIGAIALAIGVLLFAFRNNFGGILDILKIFVDQWLAAFQFVRTVVGLVANVLRDKLGGAFRFITNLSRAVIKRVIENFTIFFNVLIKGANLAFKPISRLFGVVKIFFNGIINVVGIAIDKLGSFFKTFVKLAAAVIGFDLNALKSAIKEFTDTSEDNADRLKDVWKETQDANTEASRKANKDILKDNQDLAKQLTAPGLPPIPGLPTAPGAPGVTIPDVPGPKFVDTEAEKRKQALIQAAQDRIAGVQKEGQEIFTIRQEQSILELQSLQGTLSRREELELEQFQARRDLLLEQGSLDKETVELLKQEEQTIRDRFNRLQLEREKQLQIQRQKLQISDLTTLKGFLGEVGVAFKEAALVLKGIRLGEAIVSVATGIANALAGPFPVNIANAAIVGAQGAAQIATIQAQQFQVGAVNIPAQIPAILDPGEMVITRSIAQGIRGGDLTLGGPGGGQQEGTTNNFNINFDGAQFLGIDESAVDQIEELLIAKREVIGSALVPGIGV